MIKITVLYGTPTDPVAFDRHYADTHMPLAAKLPKLQRAEVAKVVATADGSEAPYYQVAELTFPDMAAFGESMGTEEGQAVAADVANFATGGATVLITETFIEQ